VSREATAADHKKYAAVERSLTLAANAAAASGKPEQISVMAGPKTYNFSVTGKEIAKQLSQRIIQVNPFATGAMDSPRGMIEVNRWGIDPTQGTGRETLLGNADRSRTIEFLHEGIHWTAGEAIGFGSAQRLLGEQPLRSAHQDPYNDAAEDILGPE
jgi:hypothetical protein